MTINAMIFGVDLKEPALFRKLLRKHVIAGFSRAT